MNIYYNYKKEDELTINIKMVSLEDKQKNDLEICPYQIDKQLVEELIEFVEINYSNKPTQFFTKGFSVRELKANMKAFANHKGIQIIFNKTLKM